MTHPQKQALSQILFKKMHEWLWGHAQYYDLFTVHDKSLSMANEFNELTEYDKDLLIDQLDFVIQKKPYLESGLPHFTVQKEKYMMEVAKSLIS